jgi:hypothetical protein
MAGNNTRRCRAVLQHNRVRRACQRFALYRHDIYIRYSSAQSADDRNIEILVR